MSRPKKATVDYFPHYVNHGKTIFMLESKFGNDGYACWFKILELLGKTEHHFLDCNEPVTWEFLLAKTRLSEVIVTDILNLLAKIDAIDKELWKKRVIRSQNFIDGLYAVYRRREVDVIEKDTLMGLLSTETPLNGINVGKKPHSIVEYSIETYKESDFLKIVFDIMSYFNFTELRNPDKLYQCHTFINVLNSNNRLKYFEEQFYSYKKYKILNNEKIHSFNSFIGTIENKYEDGGWNLKNWTAELQDKNIKLQPVKGLKR